MTQVEGLAGLIAGGFQLHPLIMGFPAGAALAWVAWYSFRQEWALVGHGLRLIAYAVVTAGVTLAASIYLALGAVDGTPSLGYELLVLFLAVCALVAYYSILAVLAWVSIRQDRIRHLQGASGSNDQKT